MAKSKNRNTTYDVTTSTYRQARVTAVNATTRVVRPVVIVRPLVSYLPVLGEDRRTFHPDGPFRTPFSSPRSAARLVVKRAHKSGAGRNLWSLDQSPPVRVGFNRPDRVAICVRRKARREVLFASGVGGSRTKRGKRTFSSGFSCK